jgi:hypothetical protein
MPDLHLARFDLDATPPLGHSLCGGWIKPVVGVDDPLKMRGVVIEGAGLPIVLATVDWTGVLNESYRIWTEQLAEAAHTTPDRVSLHAVHQHNAPFVDLDGNALLIQGGANTLLYDQDFFDKLVKQSAAAVRAAMSKSLPVTHIRHGDAKIEQVACNRRVIGANGKIKYSRTSATTNPAARAEPDGTIDPLLRSISFLNRGNVLARLYYYAVHPMSYYGDGRVSSDFVGLARAHRDRDEPETLHVYFTGCSGNVTAGKYNDGSHPNRAVLADRIHAAMTAADLASKSHEERLDSIVWASKPHQFKAREDLDLDKIKAIVMNPKETVTNRNRSSMTAAWLIRNAKKRPINLARLDLGSTVSSLHLPAESFIEYQLDAQAVNPKKWLATAAYSDDGPWYIPIQRSYAEGGYEPGVSFVSPSTEADYKAAIRALLKA